jgi:uncharacterized protein (DUF342 family)
MEKSIVSKGKNVKAAVSMALDLLDAQIKDVEIEIVETESKGILGIGAKPAVVRVTLRKGPVPDEVEPSLFSEDRLKQAIENINEEDIENILKSDKSSFKIGPVRETKELSGKAWVRDGQIFCKNSPDQYPIVNPDKRVKLYVNDVLFEDKVVVNEGDIARIEIDDEVQEPVWELKISDDKMEALMVVKTPGARICRKLKNKEPASYIQLEVEERRESIPIEQSLVKEKLKDLGIVHGIDYIEIAKACRTEERGSFIIAVGTKPAPGQNGHFLPVKEVDIKKRFKERSDGTIDYKETQEFPSIERGQVLGIVHPPRPGEPGVSVTGEQVMPPDVHPVVAKMGKGAVLLDSGKVVATEQGHPEIKGKGHLVIISVVPKLVIHKDITLQTGNIHYIGDVEVHGSVQDGMQIDAQGNVLIHHNVNMAKVHSGNSIIIHQNIISAEVTAGKNNILIAELSQILGELAENMKKMTVAIEQLSAVSAFKVNSFTRTGLGPLIKILCDGKFKSLLSLTMTLVKKIKNGSETQVLDDEWLEFGDRIYKGFIMAQNSNLQSVADVISIIKKAEELYQSCQITEEDHSCFIQAGFVHNSQLYSSGDISVAGQGCYNSKLHADGFIRVEGYVRGGDLYGSKGVEIGEAGSNGGITTKISVPRDQSIQIRKALEDTLIQIGPVRHKFLEETTHVHARLDKEGILQLH